MPSTNPKFKTYYRFGLLENWTWRIFWFSLPFYVTLSILFDVLLTGIWSPLWVVIFATVTFYEIAVVIIAKKTFLPWLLSKPGKGLYGLLFAGILNSSRNLLTAFLALELGLETKIDWTQRAIVGFTGGVIFFLIFVSVAGSRIQHDASMQKLKSLQNSLVRTRTELPQVLATENQNLLEQTQNSLLPRINKIAELLQSNNSRDESILQLRSLVQDQVRPLSEQLRKGGSKLSEAPMPIKIQTVKTQFFTERFVLRQAIRPIGLFVVSCISQILVLEMMFGASVTLENLPFIALGFLILLAVAALIPKQLITSRKQGTFILCMLFGGSGAPLYLVNVDKLIYPAEALMFSTVILFPIIFGIALGNSAVLDNARVLAEKHMVRENAALTRELALFEQKLWIAKRNWSFVVHGTVQAALTAAISRLSSSEQPEQYQINLVLQDIKRAQDALLKAPEVNVDLNSALNAIVSTWNGICTVTWSIGERATRALVRDNNVRMCVNEIVKEAISNAVRHGNASKAHVEINRGSDEFVEIVVSNNGRAPSQKSTKGLGSRMFDELTYNWSLVQNRAQGTTVLSAILPISIN